MNNVVARFADGRIVKGVSMNVDITKPACHVRTSDGKMEEVRLADLKALFFVKSLDGDSAHNEAMAAEATDPRARGSILVELRFIEETEGRTRVELEHRNIDRHGPGWEAVAEGIGHDQGWQLYLDRYAALFDEAI